MYRLIPQLVILVCGGGLCMLGGCMGSPPTHFYVLAPLQNSAPLPRHTETSRNLALGIGPINLPEYLDRPAIVTQTSAYQLDLAEFDQWAEPLSANFARVMAENLSHLLSSDDVVVYPWSRSAQVDYQVVVDVMRFEGSTRDDSRLTARWMIVDSDGDQERVRRQADIKIKADGQGYEAIVAAMSRAVGALSHDIAVALQTLLQQVSRGHGSSRSNLYRPL